MNSELKKVLRALERQGWTATLRRGGHWKLTAPDGAPYFTGSSPSDRRGFRNMTADLKRMGANL